MTETRNRPDIDELDLGDLATLRPVRLDKAAPGWELGKQQILHDVLPEHHVGPRGRWLGVAVAAAAAVAVVGGVLRVLPNHVDVAQQSVVPGAPTGATVPMYRTIPQGKYLVVRTDTTVSSGTGKGDTQRTQFLEAWDSSYTGRGHLLKASRPDAVASPTSSPTPEVVQAQAPSDPGKATDWLLTGGGGATYRPKASTPTSPTIPRDQQVFENVVGYVANPLVSKQFKQVLLQVARSNGAATSVTTKQSNGRKVLELGYVAPAGTLDAPRSDRIVLDADTLDVISTLDNYSTPAATSVRRTESYSTPQLVDSIPTK